MKSFIIIWGLIFCIEAAASSYTALTMGDKPKLKTRYDMAVNATVAIIFVLTGAVAMMVDN